MRAHDGGRLAAGEVEVALEEAHRVVAVARRLREVGAKLSYLYEPRNESIDSSMLFLGRMTYLSTN